jgi:hypothetical protein
MSAFTTPPTIAAGSLAAQPQPILAAPGGLLHARIRADQVGA